MKKDDPKYKFTLEEQTEIETYEQEGLRLKAKMDELTADHKKEKTLEQKRDEKLMKKDKEWKIIKLINVYLLYYAVIDFTFQVLVQLPYVPNTAFLRALGFRKIYEDPGN